jgi:hypothetical protein
MHAVKWTIYNFANSLRHPYTSRWHATNDALLTLCGRPIPVGGRHAFLPDTDDDLSVVDCKVCATQLRMQSDGGTDTAKEADSVRESKSV